MADFTKYSNYNEETSFSGVIFGANAPVLEVEMNELQEINDTKFSRLSNIVGSCVHPLSNGSVSYNPTTKVLTLTNCVVVIDSFSAFIDSATVTLSATKKYAYLKLEEKTVTGASTLKRYGNTAGSVISNPIYDSRLGHETTRRRIIVVTIIAGNSIPANSDTIKYVPIGELSNSEFIAEYVINTITDLGFSVNEDGELCVVYDEED